MMAQQRRQFNIFCRFLYLMKTCHELHRCVLHCCVSTTRFKLLKLMKSEVPVFDKASRMQLTEAKNNNLKITKKIIISGMLAYKEKCRFDKI